MTHPTLEGLTDLDRLVTACEAEFCSPGTELGEPDEGAVAFPSSAITFGHIRRARSALSALTAAIAAELPPTEPGAMTTTGGGAPRRTQARPVSYRCTSGRGDRCTCYACHGG